MKLKKKGINWYVFITIVVILVIALILILSNTDYFRKVDAFVSTCKSIPFFEYKCANTIGDGKIMTCPLTDNWNVDRSKECDKVNKQPVECCYRAQ